jgi:hypothetical protein
VDRIRRYRDEISAADAKPSQITSAFSTSQRGKVGYGACWQPVKPKR